MGDVLTTREARKRARDWLESASQCMAAAADHLNTGDTEKQWSEAAGCMRLREQIRQLILRVK